MQRFFGVVLIATGLLGGASAARAAAAVDPSAATLQAAIPGHSGLRWGEAVKTFLTDAHATSDDSVEASAVADFRHIDGDDAYADPPRTIHVTSLSARDVVEHGKPRLLVLAEIEPPEGALGMAFLALIDPTPKPRLLDLVDVAVDRDTNFDDTVHIKIARDSDLIVTYSAHLDAGEDADNSEIIYVRGDRLAKLAEVPTQSLSACRYDATQTQALAIVPDPRAEFDSLRITVSERVKHTKGDCGGETIPKAGLTTWRTVYRWDPGRNAFTPLSKDLEALQKHNEAPQ
ncbi:MAG: hypothetical protein ABSC25_14395 [Roseiarcus sp.]|jgi:hypothetical protein